MSWDSKSTAIIKLIIANHEATQYHWKRSLPPNVELSTFSRKRLLLITVFWLYLGGGGGEGLIGLTHTLLMAILTRKLCPYPTLFAKLAKGQGKTSPDLSGRCLFRTIKRPNCSLCIKIRRGPWFHSWLPDCLQKWHMERHAIDCGRDWKRKSTMKTEGNWRHGTLRAYHVYFQMQNYKIRHEVPRFLRQEFKGLARRRIGMEHPLGGRMETSSKLTAF